MDNEAEIRKKKIDTAVKFLQNPRVRQSPMSQRRSFLEKKGLTKEEINEAIELSGTAIDENRPLSIVPSGALPPPPPPPTIPWTGYFGAAVIGGGLGYLLINLIKTYILPLVFNLKEKDEKLDRLERAVAATNATLDSVQQALSGQGRMMENISSDLAQTQDKLAGLPTDSYSVGELKSEIVSLKGLLLNRKQFPPAVIGSPQSPGIPAWQRTATPPVPQGSKGENIVENGRETPNNSLVNGETHEPEIINLNQEQLSSSSSSSACTPETMKLKDSSHIDASLMNNALISEDVDVSNDTTVSSLSDLSANASFHEASIAFSSTCIKIPAADMTSTYDEAANGETQEVD